MVRAKRFGQISLGSSKIGASSNRGGILPSVSNSIRRTLFPTWEAKIPRAVVMVVFPTPPFPITNIRRFESRFVIGDWFAISHHLHHRVLGQGWGEAEEDPL